MIGRLAPLGVALALSLCGAGAAIADEISPADDPAALVRVGVAPFEAAGPSGVEVPDFARLLSDLLGSRGVGRIVGPERLGAPAAAHAEPRDARAWASAAEVDGVVVGRTTRIGSRLSVDVRLLSAESGTVADTYIAEIANPDQTTPAVATLAEQVIAGVLALVAPDVAAAPPAARGSGSDASPSVFDSSAPISITSQALEAAEVDGNRRLVFSGDVNVVQGDIAMTSDRLTADYPKGSSEPSRLVAQGAVRVVQGSQEARCDNGTFQRSEDLLICCGRAELRDGASRVRGKCIEFDLAEKTVRVEDAVVNIVPETADSGAANPGGR